MEARKDKDKETREQGSEEPWVCWDTSPCIAYRTLESFTTN